MVLDLCVHCLHWWAVGLEVARQAARHLGSSHKQWAVEDHRLVMVPQMMQMMTDADADQEETWTLHPEVRASSPESKASAPPSLAKLTLLW